MFVASVLLMPSLFFFFFARLVQPPFWLFAAFLPSPPRRPSYRVLPSLSPHNSMYTVILEEAWGGTARPPLADKGSFVNAWAVNDVVLSKSPCVCSIFGWFAPTCPSAPLGCGIRIVRHLGGLHVRRIGLSPRMRAYSPAGRHSCTRGVAVSRG